MRADRLLSLVLLLQARGSATAYAMAGELGVSIRTIYRDLDALGAAGVPVITEAGPGGGCRLMDGYRFPLRGLRPEEAEALLILGVPAALRELGLDRALATAHQQIRATSGPTAGAARGAAGPGAGALVHLDMPRWFGGQQEVPCLRELALALRLGRVLEFRYQPADDAGVTSGGGARLAGPLGLVNKAGTWYLVAARLDQPQVHRVYRAARLTGARVRPEPFARPPDFDLPGFWAHWSAEFEATRPRLGVRLRASPAALAAFGEVFGPAVRAALDQAGVPDGDGWSEVSLSFEHETAAAHRLAGFGDQVEVLDPPEVRTRLLTLARRLLHRYGAGAETP